MNIFRGCLQFILFIVLVPSLILLILHVSIFRSNQYVNALGEADAYSSLSEEIKSQVLPSRDDETRAIEEFIHETVDVPNLLEDIISTNLADTFSWLLDNNADSELQLYFPVRSIEETLQSDESIAFISNQIENQIDSSATLPPCSTSQEEEYRQILNSAENIEDFETFISSVPECSPQAISLYDEFATLLVSNLSITSELTGVSPEELEDSRIPLSQLVEDDSGEVIQTLRTVKDVVFFSRILLIGIVIIFSLLLILLGYFSSDSFKERLSHIFEVFIPIGIVVLTFGGVVVLTSRAIAEVLSTDISVNLEISGLTVEQIALILNYLLESIFMPMVIVGGTILLISVFGKLFSEIALRNSSNGKDLKDNSSLRSQHSKNLATSTRPNSTSPNSQLENLPSPTHSKYP